MKKSSLVAMILGFLALVFFALGMCMTMVTEFYAFIPGIIMGCIGLILAIVTIMVWRKMENNTPITFDKRTVLVFLLAAIGILTLGVGMCMVLLWGKSIVGVIVGIIGIAILLGLIPVIKGIKD